MMLKKERVQFVVDELEKLYPVPPIPLDHQDAFTLLIAVLLSAQTTDKKVNEVTKDLFKDYPDLDTLLTVTNDELEERIKQITQNAQKFIYMVAYAGITGSGQKEDLTTVINNVRKHSSTPLYIGFGVDENTCKEKIIGVDGVIVGSAFVKHIIDDSLSNDEKIKKISAIAKEIKEKINE